MQPQLSVRYSNRKRTGDQDIVVYAGSQRLAQVVSGSPQYYITDHLGSTRAVIASTGSSIGTTDYWPYGATVQQGRCQKINRRF